MRQRKVTNPIAVAREWLARGIMPIPIRAGSHKPKGGEGWNKVKVTEDNLEDYFTPGDNVGGLWGKPSHNIIDVDLDWDEAVALAPHILPPTFMYGRSSRPRSHYLYKCVTPTFKRGSLGKDGSVIIEIRSTGTQSVLPPSIHPDKERYEINSDVAIESIKLKKLERLVNKLAVLSVMARYYPDNGRHDYVHALTGALLWSQWGAEEVAESLYLVLDVVGNLETERDQRERTIINTIEKFGEEQSVNGWPTLLEMVGPDTQGGKEFELSRKWASRKKAGRITLKSKKKKKTRVEAGDEQELPPEDLGKYVTTKAVNPPPSFEVPGLVGKLTRWIHRTSYADQPMFDLGAAFTTLALATQNRYLIEDSKTPLSPFFMALGRTGGGKDSARQSVITAANQIRLADKCLGGFQSFHALLDELAKPPSVLCWLWDEAARKMRAAAKSSGSPESAVITWLLDLYGKGNSTVLGLPGRKQSITKLDHPFLVVLAFAQPEDMISAITMTDMSTGVLNRFILLDAGDDVPPLHYPDYRGFPSALIDALMDIARVRPAGDADFIPVNWENARTLGFSREFREDCRQISSAESSSGEIWGRAWQNALILAGLIAVGIDHKRPVITQDIIEWSSDFIRWACNNWTIRLTATASRSLTEKNSKTIEQFVRNASAYRKMTKSKEELALIRNNRMPRTLLLRLCRHIRSRDIDDTIATLVDADTIGSVTVEDGLDYYWWKPTLIEDI